MSEVIVIGGGIAGICAALELLDAGRSVLLLERDTAEGEPAVVIFQAAGAFDLCGFACFFCILAHLLEQGPYASG